MCALPFSSASTRALYDSGMIVTTVYPVRWVNWEAISFAASICSCELAVGGRARINGFSASLQTESGKEAFQTAYEVEEMAPVNDGYFVVFHRYMSASGLDFTTLVK